MKFIKETNYKLKPLTDREALDELTEYFLGEDWYVSDPLGVVQVNAIIVDEIKAKYPKPLRKKLYKKLSEFFEERSKRL